MGNMVASNMIMSVQGLSLKDIMTVTKEESVELLYNIDDPKASMSFIHS